MPFTVLIGDKNEYTSKCEINEVCVKIFQLNLAFRALGNVVLRNKISTIDLIRNLLDCYNYKTKTKSALFKQSTTL